MDRRRERELKTDILMKELEAIDLIKVNGCIVKDDDGRELARLEEVGRKVRVHRLPACSIGMYLYILTYLKGLGFTIDDGSTE